MAWLDHEEALFRRLEHKAVRARIERGNKPDFIFPGQSAYDDPLFPVSGLTMLAAKSVCKERWRQILPEADRMTAKHLVTIEPGISTAQTDQMRAHDLQLVVPASLHSSYQPAQRSWIWPVAAFLALVARRQPV